MTFLNPLLLFGLLAASIPILLHLLNLRKLKTIEFSTLQFLKEIQKTKMRRVKIKQWLLLALRTLMIMAIVFAFSRPALRGYRDGFPFVGSTHAKTTIILLLDDSPSMNIRNEHGVLFEQAKTAVSRILEVMDDGDEAYLVKLSDARRPAYVIPSSSSSALRKTLEQLHPSVVSASFRDAFGVTAKMLAESKNVNQEIYLITDAQAAHFAINSNDTTDLFGDAVKLFLVDVTGGSSSLTNNAGITSSQILSKIISQNKLVSLKSSIQNVGSTPLHNSVLSLYLDGTRLAQQSLDIGAQGTVAPVLRFAPKRKGIQSGYLQIEDDAFETDNKHYFVLDVPSRIRVLAIGASPNDTRLPALALTLDHDSTTGGVFAIEQTTEAQLASFDVNKFDYIMIAGAKDFSVGEAERLAHFVEAGGGMLIFPGREADIKHYNDVLFRQLEIPPSQAGTSLETGVSSSFVTFSKIDFDHPLFAELLDPALTKARRPNIESPKIYRGIQPRAGSRGRSIVSLSDGTSFLTEYQHGSGKVLLFSVEAGLTWSDFPLKGLFAPLLHRIGQYLAGQSQPPQFVVGDELRFAVRLKGRTEKDTYVLRSPSGIDERIVPQVSSNTGIATFSSTSFSEVGIFELRKQSGGKESEVLYTIAVNSAPEETDLRHATDNEIRFFASQIGLLAEHVRSLPITQKIESAILESRFGIELWKYFVLFALVLALVEMIVARENREQKA